jgi:hypothetical protein
MRPTFAILVLPLAALALIEGLAWWWMNPPPAAHREPVLAYRPQGSAGVPPAEQESEIRDQECGGSDSDLNSGRSQNGMARAKRGQSGIRDQQEPTAQSASSSSNQKSKIQNQESKISSSSSSNPQSQIHNPQSEIRDQEEAPEQASSSNPKSKIQNPESKISPSSHPISASTRTPLPEIYRQAAPMLRCTSGEVFHVRIHDNASLHGAFFEWDGTDTGSVLEAFRHMPEACMGAIGMQLVSKEKPILYQVGLDRRAGRDSANGAASKRMAEDRSQRSDVRGQQEVAASSSAPSSDQKSKIKNLSRHSAATPDQDSKISRSSSSPDHSTSTPHADGDKSARRGRRALPVPTAQSLIFDHTVFRDPGQAKGPLGPGPLVHAFRAVWVAGRSSADARHGLDGREFDQLRSIRLHSALTRFRPSHARVIQGAVRGLHSPEAAWQAFEQHMLRDLTFEP